MKKLLPSFNRKLLMQLILLLGLTSSGFAQTITLSTGNCTATANEIQFDVFVTNNGPGSIQFNSAVIRFNHAAAILAGGTNTIVFSYVGSSDFPNVWPPINTPPFSYTAATRLMGVSTSTGVYLNGVGCAAPNIAAAETKKIGRFSLKNNAQNFVPGADVGLVWNTSSGMSNYVGCAQTTTVFSQAAGNRTLTPACSLFIPSSCSSPTINTNPLDQAICTPGIATFNASFTGGTPAPTIVWQVQTGGIGAFADLTEAAPYSGTATNTLTITNPGASLSTNRYRLKANNTCGDVFTNSALLTINPNANAGTVSGVSPLCIGSTTTYTSNGNAGGAWSSTNPAVASVDAAGLVTALSVGTTDITYTVNTGCASPVSAFKTLTVSPNVNAGTVSGSNNICIGVSVNYTSDGTAGGTWSSTNPLVASVDAGGLVTGLTSGTSDITYTINTGCGSPVSSFRTLNVAPNVNGGTVTGTSPLCIAATATYTSNGDAGGTWSSTNPAVATVDLNSGLVTAVAQGTTNIVYTVNLGCNAPASASKTLTVQALDYANLQFPASGTICPGGSLTAYGQVYEPGVTEAAGQGAGITVDLGYSTTNSNPATWTNWQAASFNVQVGNNDEYMATFGSALAPGTYYYTFRYSLNGCGYQYGGYSGGGGNFWDGTNYVSGVLTVSPLANAGTVSGTSPLCVLATASYTSNGDAGGTWSSTNPLVATVDAAGLVTALLPGTTDITYTVNTGCGSPVSSFKTLTVNLLAIAGTVSGTSPLCIGSTVTYTTDGTPGGTWSSTNPAVASVNAAGLVTALTTGTTDITYTVTGSCVLVPSSFKTLTVSPNANAGAVSGISPLCVGNATTYTSNGNGGGTWSSTNPAVASVNASGVVTALSTGTTDITYTVNTGCNSPISSFKTLTVNGSTALAGVAGGPKVCSTASIQQPGGTYYSDASCAAIAKVVPSGASPVAGNVNTCVTVEDVVHTYQGKPYVQRHYDIEPATNPAGSTATITLYYTQAEFDAYNLARGPYPALPNDQNDVLGIANVRITQFHGTGTYPGNYTGTSEVINPNDASIVWNATINRWEITFDINGFSGFYIFTDPLIPLPITLLNFSGRNNGNNNLLDWTTTSEQNSSYFDLMRSTDGINFVKAGTVTAAGNSNTSRSYTYSDNIAAINSAVYFYRLKMVDITGLVKYSSIVKIRTNSKGFIVEATPNPFSDQIRINIETPLQENAVISLKDISGKKIQLKESLLRKGSNVVLLTSLNNIAAGTYLLTITTDTQQQTVKVVKQ